MTMQKIVDQIGSDEINARVAKETARKKKQMDRFGVGQEPDIISINGQVNGSDSKIWGFHGIETPGEKEARIRRGIESRVRLYAYKFRYKNGRINAEIKRKFGKSREHMTLKELER